MRDRERTARMVQQLVDTLQQVTSSLKKSCTWLITCPAEQAVRATPIPVTWMTREEDSLLTGQVSFRISMQMGSLRQHIRRTGDNIGLWARQEKIWEFERIRYSLGSESLPWGWRRTFTFPNVKTLGSRCVFLFLPIVYVQVYPMWSVKMFWCTFAGDWQSISLVVTPSHLVLTRFLNTFCSFLIVLPRISFILFRDFFTWLFQSGKEQLEVLAAIDIPAIQGLVSSSIFLCSNFKQTANFIQKIRFSNGIFHFSQFSRDGLSGWALGLIQDITVWKWKRRYNCFFWSLPLPVLSDSLELYQSALIQDGVLQLVAALRTPWEASRNTALEVAA